MKKDKKEEDPVLAHSIPKGVYDLDNVLGSSRRVRIRRNREADREAENKKISLDGPIMQIRIKPDVLIEFREAVEKGYEKSFSEYINEAVMVYYEAKKNEQEEDNQA